MPIYSDKVMDHFSNPRNVGEIPDADGIGEEGNPVCGDMMTFYIKVKDDRLVDVKFKTFGCGAAIAVSSMVSEMAKGKTLEEVLKITRQDVANALNGLPANKMHCSNLGADALHKAIKNYLAKKETRKCNCPVCDGTLPCADTPYCKPCDKTFKPCKNCGKLIEAHETLCPDCGK